MTTHIQYGSGLPDEAELRLVGDLSGGKRAIELGVREPFNSIAFALAEAKAIAVDPNPDRIELVRAAAAEHEVYVECHVGDLADLGFATSGSVECIIARHSLSDVDDISRTLRQANRVLRSSRPLIMTVPHPFGAIVDDTHGVTEPYGGTTRTIGEWFTLLSRNNFRVDQILELGRSEQSSIPTTLLVRARKEGD